MFAGEKVLNASAGNLGSLGQAGTASTTLTADAVGTTRLTRKPALPGREPYSAAVRSCVTHEALYPLRRPLNEKISF